MAARLEVEIDGVNTGLKKALNESLVELTRFNRALNIRPTGVNALNASLTTTKRLLQDIANLSQQTRNPLGGAGGGSQNTSAELNAARVASENYRTESARLRSELDALRLANAQNRQSTTAAAGSYREAQQRLTALGRSIREAEGGFRSTNPAIQAQIREYRRLNDELKRFDAQMGNHQRDVGRYGKALEGLKGLAAGAFGFTALLAVGKQVLNNNAQISDSLSDVRRTAGLTAKEVNSLSESLKEINTRTSLKGLVDIAVIGGQLGIAKNQLSGFTKAVDELAVTLSGELKGGPEGIAKSLGVLDNVFKVTASNSGDVEKSYNQIGSAILGLGQSGLATGDFLADFGERVGGVAKQAGISLPVILSYAAVLQENGVSAEVAGTAFKRLISAISSNSGKFFQVAKFADANLTLKSFNTLVNTDTKKALDLFFQGINKGGSSTIAFNSILKSLKLSGAGASQVVSALANNTQALESHIKNATKDFNEATLSGEQFAIKNDNLAGSVDKLGKAFENVTTSGSISSFFKAIVDGATSSVNALGVLSKAVGAFTNLLTRPKGFIGDTALTSRQKADKELLDNAKKSAAIQVKNQVGREEAFQLQKKEIAILVEVNKKYIEQKKIFDSIDAGDRTLTQTKTFQELENKVKFQKQFVKSLKDEYTKLFLTIEKSDSAAPDLKDDKKPKKVAEIINRAPEIIRQSNNSAGIAEVNGVKETLTKLTQTYAKYYSDLRSNSIKSAEGRKTFEKDLATLQANEIKERGAIELTERNRVAGELERINNIAAEKLADSKDKELAEINKRYDGELRKAGITNEIILALNSARFREENAVAEKFEAKRVEMQTELTTKIQDLAEKGFTLNENFSRRTTQKNKEALNERLKDISAHFDKLKKLFANNPLALTALGIAQTGAENQATGNFNSAENGASEKILSDLAVSFGNSFFRTLSTINQQADRSFVNIIGTIGQNITGMLQDTFGTQLSGILNKLIDGTEISATQAIAGIAGVVGGLVSGITKKTSFAGQAAGGALTGAATGALAGSAIPGIGTVAGAVVGGLVGALGGLLGAGKARKEERELQKRQLEEAQKQTEIMRQNAMVFTSSIIGRMTDQGILTNVDIGAFGQLKATVSGKQIEFVLDRTKNTR